MEPHFSHSQRGEQFDSGDRVKLDTKAFAFPDQEKEPIENATHVRNAIARFNPVKGVSDAERDAAWKRIKAAAQKFDVDRSEGLARDRQRLASQSPIC